MITLSTIIIVTILSYTSISTEAIPLTAGVQSMKDAIALFKSRHHLLLKENPLLPFENTANDINLERRKRQLNTIQSKIIDFVHPKPIVDTLREEDKYGNTVEHTFGKNIVKVVENISNVINTVFAFPINTAKKASRTATEVLNNIGGKLVGLQK